MPVVCIGMGLGFGFCPAANKGQNVMDKSMGSKRAESRTELLIGGFRNRVILGADVANKLDVAPSNLDVPNVPWNCPVRIPPLPMLRPVTISI